MTTDIRVESQDRRRSRKGGVAYLRFGLAGVALLGIGAAATSAAWTDQAWFGASATAAKVELAASLDGTSYSVADAEATAVTIPFDLLNAGATVTKTVWVRNEGSVPVTVSAPVVAKTGLFTGSGTGSLAPAAVTVSNVADTVLDPNEATSATVTVVTPVNWDDSFQSQTGTLTITFTGQS